jgi:hypothetical protein
MYGALLKENTQRNTLVPAKHPSGDSGGQTDGGRRIKEHNWFSKGLMCWCCRFILMESLLPMAALPGITGYILTVQFWLPMLS